MTRLDYLTLITSLPPMPAPGRARQLPISQQRLAQRLRMLADDDAVLVERLRRDLGWSLRGAGDLATAASLRELIEAPGLPGDLRSLVDMQYRLRTLLSALRGRRCGGSPAEPPVGAHPALLPRLRAHATEADFGLGPVLAFATPLVTLFEAGNGFELEQFLIDLQWRWYVDAGFGHEFDLVAVALYALRFDLLRQALAADGPSVQQRVQALIAAIVDGALGERPGAPA